MEAFVVVMSVIVVVLAVLVAGVLRSHAEILRALHDLGIGEEGRPRRTAPATVPGVAEPRPEATPAFDVEGRTPDGRTRHVGVVGAGHSTLLAFLSSGCTVCRAFWAAFSASDQLRLPGADTRLVIVTKDAAEESPARLQSLAPRTYPVVMSSAAWNDYRVPLAPYFILVDGPSGRTIGEGAAPTWPHVMSLLRQALEDAGIADSDGRPMSGYSSGEQRERRADDELRAAGIEPGHPSLYPTGPPERPDEEADR